MTPNGDQSSKVIQIRLTNAEQALADARLLLERRSLRGATNRVYYSMFHAVSALAFFCGRTYSKHSGLIAFFQKEFAKPNLIERKHGRALQKAFEDRSEADYEDFIRLTDEQVDLRIHEAEEFLAAIKEYINAPILEPARDSAEQTP